MENNCKNCDIIFTGNFCENCGQKKYKRIDKKYIWDEIQYTFLHTNKGFLYSVKSLLKNPGKTAKEFIEGNRVNHYKPILLTFVLSGISAFISFKIIGLNEIMGDFYANQKLNSEFMNDYLSFISSYNSFIMLLSIPFFAFFTKIAFYKWGHNYYEHIVMNSYILSFYTLFSIIFTYPFMYYFKHDETVFMSITSIQMFLTPLLLIWFFKEMYPDKKLLPIILRVALSILVMVVTFFLLMLLVMIGGFVYAMTNGPEGLKYLIPKK